MLNIAEHENFSANKYENANILLAFLCAGIFIFISRENFMDSWTEHENIGITPGPDFKYGSKTYSG